MNKRHKIRNQTKCKIFWAKSRERERERVNDPYRNFCFAKTVAILFCVVFCFFGLGFGAKASAASNWYVSPSGNNSNPGTLSQPKLTLSATFIAASSGDTINVLPGTYNITTATKIIWTGKDITVQGVDASGNALNPWQFSSFPTIQGTVGDNVYRGMYVYGNTLTLKNIHIKNFEQNGILITSGTPVLRGVWIEQCGANTLTDYPAIDIRVNSISSYIKLSDNAAPIGIQYGGDGTTHSLTQFSITSQVYSTRTALYGIYSANSNTVAASNGTISGLRGSAVKTNNASASFTGNNILAFGNNAATAGVFYAQAGAINLTNCAVNVGKDKFTLPWSAGVTVNNCLTHIDVNPVSYNRDEAYFVLNIDSATSYGTDQNTDIYGPIYAAAKVVSPSQIWEFTALVDVAQDYFGVVGSGSSWTPVIGGQWPKLQALIDEGHEIAYQGWAHEKMTDGETEVSAMRVQYNGSQPTAQLVISGDYPNITWALEAPVGTVIKSYDLTDETQWKRLGDTISSYYYYGSICHDIALQTSWNCDVLTGTQGHHNETPKDLKNGTYNAHGAWVSIPYDSARFQYTNITLSKSILESYLFEADHVTPYLIKNFSYPITSYDATTLGWINGVVETSRDPVDTNNFLDRVNTMSLGFGTSAHDPGNKIGIFGGAGAASDNLAQNIKDMASYLSETGSIVQMTTHNIDQLSGNDLQVIVNELLKYPNIKVVSARWLNDHIRNSGQWTLESGTTYTKTLTDNADYSLQYSSSAIDTGTPSIAITDYAGNPIYGLPDIGAYEYQPPHTMGTNKIDIGAGAKIYGNGKFRDVGTTNSTLADLKITPSGGTFSETTSPIPAWLDISGITWNNSGNHHKVWTESNAEVALNNTDHVVGDLESNKYYNVTVDGEATNLSGCSAVEAHFVCQANSQGKISFTYTGGYSTHVFDVAENPVPTTPIIGTPLVLSSSSIRWNFTGNASDEIGFRIYDNLGNIATSSATTNLSYLDETGLSENTQYSGRYATAYNSYGNSASSSVASSVYTLVDTPTNFSASLNSNNITLTVDSFPNDTNGSSGYYFSRSGANSGWIQTNSWTDTGLSCGHSYDYSVIYRNGDGTETSSISTTKSTSGCGGGGMPAGWSNLPIIPTGGFKVFINSGTSTTTTRIVNLSFNAGSDVKKMAISMTGDFNDASQENYNSIKQIDLCSKFGVIKNPTCPDGTYKVYVKFYTYYGQSSGIASGTIVLKSGTTPTENLQQTNNLPFTNPFIKYLQYRQTNADIKRLQIFLNSDPTTQIAKSGAGSPGKETNYFGLLTYRAVIKLQEKYAKDILAPWGFAKGTGYVGKTTLAKINELMGNK